MATVKDSDLKELKALISDRFDEQKRDIEQLKQDFIQQKQDFGQLKQDVGQIKQDVGQIKQEMYGMDKRLTIIETTLLNQQSFVQKIPDLAEKVGELKNWRQFIFILVTASVSGLIGWLVRGGKL